MRREPTRRAAPGFMLAGDEEGDAELSHLEAGLEIDARDLESEAAGQPALLYRALLRAARLEGAGRAAEMELEGARARVVGYLRTQAQDRAQPPPDAVLEARANQHADVDKAARKAAEGGRKLLLARALADAYRHRGEILVVLCGKK